MINNKYPHGVSLPLAIGLTTLLFLFAVAANEIIIKNLQSVRRIEASNRAYFAAEAGLEDALYELSAHYAGYQTPPLLDVDKKINTKARLNKFDNSDWENKWSIQSRSGLQSFAGKIYKNEKLYVYLFNDTAYKESATDKPSAINADAATISALNVASNFRITFTLPDNILGTAQYLQIDNDNDGKLNEDPEVQGATITCPSNPLDDDCDGQTDEDSDKDPVILWKLTDGSGKSLMPKKGCLKDLASGGSEFCEKDFSIINSRQMTLDQNTEGVDETGANKKISDFITATANTAQLHFEFLLLIPMEHTEITGLKKTLIPYFSYEVNSSLPSALNDLSLPQIPYPYYTIQTDGYYRGFKQSITTTVTPKTTVPLFDFTIIQQE